MRRAMMLLIIALAGCGAPNGQTNQQPDRNEGAMANFKLTTDAFDDGATIPRQFTCDGEDLSPALTWSDPPAGTQSFALVVDDPDAPSGVFGHWAAFDIDRQSEGLAQGSGNDPSPPFSQGRNDFGRTGYGGPCPPPGHGPHRYRFKLYALDVEQLTELGGGAPSVGEVEQAAQSHAIDRAELVGTFERKGG